MAIEFKDFITVFFSVPIGVATYGITNYVLEPMKEYRDIKHKIISDLLYYDDVVEISSKNGIEADKQLARVAAFKKHAADIVSIYHKLPKWHKVHRWETDEFPLKAVYYIFTYAHSDNRNTAEGAIKEIKKLLKLPE